MRMSWEIRDESGDDDDDYSDEEDSDYDDEKQ